MKIVYRRSELMKQVAELEDIPDEYTYNSREVWEELEARLDAQDAAKRKHVSILARMAQWYTTVGKRVAFLLVLCILLPILLPIVDKPTTIRGMGSMDQKQYAITPDSISKTAVPIEKEQADNITHHRKPDKQAIVKEPVKLIDSTNDKSNNSFATLKLPDSGYVNPDPIKQIAVKPKYKFRIAHINEFQTLDHSVQPKQVETQIVVKLTELKQVALNTKARLWFGRPG